MDDTPYTVAELETLVRRLDPAKLCFERAASDFDEEALTEFARLLITSTDPRRRLANVEYLLLLMHQAMTVDRAAFLQKVFLPWVGLQQRTFRHRRRIGREFARLPAMDAYSDEDAEHIAQHIYRPLVAEILDPYLTLLVASYEFASGEFVDIQTTNLSSGERNKVEFLEARIRNDGGPVDLLSGYDPIVRNALSHPGSDGLIFEPGAIVFRDVKRQAPPRVTVRRWTHDELHRRVLQLLEFLISVDAAVNVFGFDCTPLMSDDLETIAVMITVALTATQRAEVRSRHEAVLERIRTDDTQSIEVRRETLARLFFRECGLREMPCTSVGFILDRKALLITAPPPPAAENDDDLLGPVSTLIRYAVISQAVYGTMFDLFVVVSPEDDPVGLSVALHRSDLEDYSAERAGLIDLLQEAKIEDRNGPMRIAIDAASLEAHEDQGLGMRFPRRGRPLSPP
ncbi:hypothetical protein [Brevundimonas naejangsanensis]|uniref:hypothetical protein n=1 Tax=Brevundimonas naejangsanensis TaxID=588932 RepID=UPI00320AD00C